MATNAPMPGPTYVVWYVRRYDSLLTAGSSYRFSANTWDEAKATADKHCPPGWEKVGMRVATSLDKQPWI